MKPLSAYKGTISSAILSVVVLGILLIPFATASHIQKVRSGDGKYEFKESMCWTIDDQEDFNNDVEVGEDCGEGGALGYDYEYVADGGDMSLNQMSYEDNILEGTIDGYGIGTVVACASGDVYDTTVLIFLTMTKEDVVGNDATRIDIFFTVSGMEEGCEYNVILFAWGWSGDGLDMGTITVNELTSIEITVDDIMDIYLFPAEGEFYLAFEPVEEECEVQPDTVIIFDMQMYCIEEMKITAIDWLGIGMIGGGFFMMFCSILMLPTIDFGGVTSRLFGKKTETGGERI